MCGIVGVIDWKHTTTQDQVSEMLGALHHRGPNDSDNCLESLSHADVWLGHARLSIIDLTAAGRQPMHYGEWVIVYNGEIYNYKEIRESLLNIGHTFTSQSDTEVILHAFQEWGENCVHQFRGMFAFSIFNKKKQELYLFRDRAGVKPLYYYISNNHFIFASELKGLVNHPAFEKNIDTLSVHFFLQRGYISSPRSIYENTYKLLPGNFLKLNLDTKNIAIKSYWKVLDYFIRPKLTVDYAQAKAILKEKLIESSQLRMVSDVPVGIFLSGGYDSTAVTASLRNNNSSSLKTFTIGFEQGVNEAPAAKRVAEYLETDHTEYICTQEEARSIIPDLPHYYDEPFADSSAIPTILVSRIARQQVTVALSADGGDELFAGYERYRSFDKYIKQLIPWQKAGLDSLVSVLLNGFHAVVPQTNYSLRHKIKEYRKAIAAGSSGNPRLFLGMGAIADAFLSDALISNNVSHFESFSWMNEWPDLNHLDAAMAVDFNTYLVEDILTKVDRATMSCSLEGREPLLDHTLIEFAAQLPVEYKFDGVITKKILKDIVHDWVPMKLMDRPKAGFSLPINSWLKSELRFLLDCYLSERALASSGLFNVDFVLKQLKLFEKGHLHYSVFIWRVLMFQMWYEKWISNKV